MLPERHGAARFLRARSVSWIGIFERKLPRVWLPELLPEDEFLSEEDLLLQPSWSVPNETGDGLPNNELQDERRYAWPNEPPEKSDAAHENAKKKMKISKKVLPLLVVYEVDRHVVG